MSAYSSLNTRRKAKANWQTWLILLLATLASMGVYLAVSANNLRIGFPLDDAWIHQTYARNLALRGEWAFIPGQASGGSTSPLWTVLLAAGYIFRFPPFNSAFFLGGFLLMGLAAQTWKGVAQVVDGYQSRFPWVGLVVIFEWHFMWSSVSGMETLLHSVVILSVTLLLIRTPPPWMILGLLTGLSVWVRPDGITLLGPILLTAIFIEREWKDITRAFLLTLLGFAILFIPYLLFNYSLSGKILPTTFYAKQAEYAGWQARSILNRFGESTLKFLAGPAIVLLPGVILSVKRAYKGKKWGQLAMFLWMLGYLGIYMLRLPAYQHGRYLIPAMPVFFFLGMSGIVQYFIDKHVQDKLHRIVRLSWGVSLLILCIGFWILGLFSYSADVEFIETEMVDTARWVKNNIPADALVAAHDIGALGYFDDHSLVDLAGLISPEVIPFLLDEDRLSDYLDQQHVSYLIAFPDWYSSLTSELIPVFTTGAAYAPSVGETNMTVYQWSHP
jgi:hypothetical protein